MTSRSGTHLYLILYSRFYGIWSLPKRAIWWTNWKMECLSKQSGHLLSSPWSIWLAVEVPKYHLNCPWCVSHDNWNGVRLWSSNSLNFSIKDPHWYWTMCWACNKMTYLQTSIFGINFRILIIFVYTCSEREERETALVTGNGWSCFT